MDMNTQRSSFDRIKTHLAAKGCFEPVAAEQRDDLEMLVRRADDAAEKNDGEFQVELSPYMRSLMRVSGEKPSLTQTLARFAASL